MHQRRLLQHDECRCPGLRIAPGGNEDDYPNAKFEGTCNASEQTTLPKPACLCNYGDFPPDPSICDNDSSPGEGSTTGSTSAGAPTTGNTDTGTSTGTDTGTSTGIDTDTDGPGVELWLCSEHAHENCQVRTDNDQSACWAGTATPQRAQCVRAATSVDAETLCECLCQKEDDTLTDACDNPGFCQVSQHLDCVVPYPDSLNNNADSPLAISADEEAEKCDGIAEICDPNGGVQLFDAAATLVLNDGTSAALTNIVGYLHYTTSGCANDICSLEVDLLVIRLHNATGTYLQGSTSNTYGIDDLRLHMRGSLNGSWYQSRGTVAFPTSSFVGLATMGSVSIGSLPPTTPPATMFNTDQVVGALPSSTAPLTLNFAFGFPYGTATLTLTTR